MSLNNIQLQSCQLADLYSNSLVETGVPAPPEKQQVRYLGNNQKNILVVVSHPSIPFLPDKELSFLTSILAACKLSVADIAVVNYTRVAPADLQGIIDSEAKTVLLFNVEPLALGLPINFPPFQLQAFNNRIYLHAPALSQIENDKGLKMSLWTSLKTLFGI